MHFRRPSHKVDQKEARKGEKDEDTPVAPYSAILAITKSESFQVLISRGVLTQLAVIGSGRIQDLNLRGMSPG